MNVVDIKQPDTTNRDKMVKLLETRLAQVKSGYITRCGVVFETMDGKWGTEFAASDDRRVDAAMLIELGLRRLSFNPKD